MGRMRELLHRVKFRLLQQSMHMLVSDKSKRGTGAKRTKSSEMPYSRAEIKTGCKFAYRSWVKSWCFGIGYGRWCGGYNVCLCQHQQPKMNLDKSCCFSSPPRPRGVKDGAVTACDEKVGFFCTGCRIEGVKDGDSTFRVFLVLEVESLIG